MFEPGDDNLKKAETSLPYYHNLETVGIYLPRVTADEDQPDIGHMFDILPSTLANLEVFYTLYPDYRFVHAIQHYVTSLRPESQYFSRHACALEQRAGEQLRAHASVPNRMFRCINPSLTSSACVTCCKK